jgi:hypothetical protein
MRDRKVDELKGWKKPGFQLLFVGSFSFTGGVLFLLFFLAPLEQWLQEQGSSQETVDALVTVLVVGWVIMG